MSRILKNTIQSKQNSTPNQPRWGATYHHVKYRRLLLKTHPQFNEKWIEERFRRPINFRDWRADSEGSGTKSTRSPTFGPAVSRPGFKPRYEVEIQLGKTDECYIFRTIEYWDLERKRYPQYDHVAVLIAEDITSRFLNIIGLLNGFVPLIAIQLNSIQIGDQIALIFIVVLDQPVRLAPEEEEDQQVADRSYWEKRSSKNNGLYGR